MSRVFLVMLGYNTTEMVEGGMKNIEETMTPDESNAVTKLLFLCQYPIPSVEKNRADLHHLARKYGWLAIEIPNVGVVQNHNVAIHDYCKMSVGDYYVTADPDVRWQDKGWITASIDALESDPDIVFVCAAREFYGEQWFKNEHGQTIYRLPSGLRVAKYQHLIAWSTGMYKGEWLASRPRDFKASNEVYGFGEHRELERMNQHGKKWISLVDHRDFHLCSEYIYSNWKKESAEGKTKIKFDEWLTIQRSQGKYL